MELLTHAEFVAKTKMKKSHHGKPGGSAKRWDYHSKARDVVSEIGLGQPKNVLEIGALGTNIVVGSDTMDFLEAWDVREKKPTYIHDARNVPWPFPDRKYELLIALRVFQHVWPRQADCFREASRVARRVLLVVPRRYANGKGMSYDEFLRLNGGIHPNKYVHTELGELFFWDADDPSVEDLRDSADRAAAKIPPFKALMFHLKHWRWRVLGKVPWAVKAKRMLAGASGRRSRP